MSMPPRLARWLAVPAALALGLGVAIASDRASEPAHAQAGSAGGGFTLSVGQLRINQRISQAAVRRSNRANERLDALEGAGGQAQGPAGPAGPRGERGPRGPSEVVAYRDAETRFPLQRISEPFATDGEPRIVGRLTLGAGGHHIDAHVTLEEPQEPEARGTCELRTGGGEVLAVAGVAFGTDPGHVARATLNLTGALAAEGDGAVVDLVCRVDGEDIEPGGDPVATGVSMTAVRTEGFTLQRPEQVR